MGLYVLSANGQTLKKVITLTKAALGDYDRFQYLTWSPDAHYILFAVGRGQNTTGYILDMDTLIAREICTGSASFVWGQWSPTGDQLLYRTLQNDQETLSIMDVPSWTVQTLAGPQPYIEVIGWTGVVLPAK
jgi:Tol biopolymer transport system component